MQQGTKIVVAVLAVALVAVIGLICLTRGNRAAEPDAAATASPTIEAEATPLPEESADTADEDEPMYEGALAGLTEEEIGKLAIAEEESSERQSNEGAEDSVD